MTEPHPLRCAQIDTCGDCPHVESDSWKCRITGKFIPDPSIRLNPPIPLWCPLPEYPSHISATSAEQVLDDFEVRFTSKREAWEQGYQDGASAVQHDLNLIRDEERKKVLAELRSERERE